MASPDYVIVTARDEAARLPATLAALARAFPQARVLVADDGSRDATAAAAAQGGAQVVAAGRRLGKGGAATLAARRALAQGASGAAVVLLCDADLGATAGRLGGLVEQVEEDHADVAVAAFARRVGGGFGVALAFAGWALRRRTGLALRAPISGQRAVRAADLPRLLPFAARFGMELGMTIDAARAGLRVSEVDLDLEHRATARSVAGFGHRARQLGDFLLVYLAWGRFDLLSKRRR